MEISAKLAPFWHEIEDTSPPVRFKLRPLTEPQVVELFGTFEQRTSATGEQTFVPTHKTWYAAGCMGLDGAADDAIEGLTIDGKPAVWRKHRSVIPFKLIVSCGVRLCTEAWGDRGQDETTKN